MKKKNSFVMYKNWKPSIDKMSLEQKGMLLDAIMTYQAGEEVTIDDLAVDIFFTIAKERFDEDRESWEKTCAARAEAGSKGGDAKANNAKQNVAKGSKTKQNVAKGSKTKQNVANVADSEYESVSEGVSESVSDGVSDSGFEEEKSINPKEKQSKKKAAASAYVDDPELNAAIVDFVEHRKKLRKPMTEKAIHLFIKRVNELAISTQEQIELINTAIERGWQTVYPRDEKARSGTTTGLDYLYEMATGGAV